jgi:Peptidase M15
MAGITDFLTKNILSQSQALNAKISGAFSVINGAITAVDNVIAKIFGLLTGNVLNLTNLSLSYEEYAKVSKDQTITSTTVDPQQVPITSSITSPTLAESAPNQSITQISPTQPNDIHVEPIGIEPPMAFRGQYPYVHTYKSESGHIKEVDDTPGHERLLDYHRTGTYQEINEKGRRVVKVVSDNYLITVGDDRIHIEGSAHVYVKGLIDITCLNDVNINVGGRVEINANEDLRIKARSIAMETTTGDVNIYSGNSFNTLSVANTSMYATSNFNTISGNSTNIAAGNNIVMGAVEALTMEATALIAMDASVVATNKGQSLPVPNAADIIVAKKTGLGAAQTREYTSVPAVLDGLIHGADDPEAGDTSSIINDAISSGRVSKKEVEDHENTSSSLTYTTADTTPTTKVKPKVVSAQAIAGLSESAISGSLKISDNFRLSDVTDGAGVLYKYTLSAQKGLTKTQLAGNLSMLAQNVLEPISKQFGPIKINNAFRSVNNNATGSNSQHCLGQAVDITYGLRSKDPDTMIAIAQWIKSHVSFDQLILEYAVNQIFTHVSFDPRRGNSQRGEVKTCPNAGTRQPKYITGLVKVNWKPGSGTTS